MPILNINRIMKEKGITNSELATLLKVSPQYISEVVNGHRNITIRKVEEIANALKVSPAELFEDYSSSEKNEVAKCPYCGKMIKIKVLG